MNSSPDHDYDEDCLCAYCAHDRWANEAQWHADDMADMEAGG